MTAQTEQELDALVARARDLVPELPGAITDLRAERDALKRLLSGAIQWNWIDFEEDCETEEGRETAKVCTNRLWKLLSEIKEALK